MSASPLTLPVLDITHPTDAAVLSQRLAQLRQQVDSAGPIAEQVATIIDDVKQNGDDALVRQARAFTNPNFTADMIRVTSDQMAQAEAEMPRDIHTALTRSIDHVRTYQTHIKPTDPATITIDQCDLGLRFTPIDRVGLTVPGGKAAYPSSVLMLAIPAQVAGVPALSMICPPPTSGGEDCDISPLVLGAAHMLGIEQLYRIGGPSAIAALTYGTETVTPVDFIAGPGNAYTQQAKRQLFGMVGIDGFFGPSEIVLLADDSANPDWIAADLIAQAEHDPGCCFFISTSADIIDRTLTALEAQLTQRHRRDAIVEALTNWSAAVLVPDHEAAYELANTIAAEHVTIATADPHETLTHLSHGGAYFLGDTTPVASGDYYAGPSHCLPTGTTARYNSGLSVYTFLKRSSVEHYPAAPSAQTIHDIAALADAEGLDGHAHSLRVRGQQQ